MLELPTPRTPDPRDAPVLRWGILGPGWIAAAGEQRREIAAVGRIVFDHTHGDKAPTRAGGFSAHIVSGISIQKEAPPAVVTGLSQPTRPPIASAKRRTVARPSPALGSPAVGLAAPYLLLSIFPAAVKILPRPGAWMETFKQFMAFPLYGTVGALIWVLTGQLGDDSLMAIFGLVAIALGAAVPGFDAARERRHLDGAAARILIEDEDAD